MPCKRKKDATASRARRRDAKTNWDLHVPLAEPREHPTAAPGQRIKETSTLRDGPSGAVKLVWEKTEPDREEQLRIMHEAFADLAASIPIAAPVKRPEICMADLLTVIPLGDPHIGMLSWRQETGANFDLAIAERIMMVAVDDLVERMPPAHTGLLLNLGDYYHANNPSNRTPQSGAPLDVDGRFEKVMRAGFAIKCRMIERMLEKNQVVHVRNNKGNHDPELALFLTMLIEQRYRDEPRVVVESSSKAHWYMQWGECLIGSTHGDKKSSASELHMIMSEDCQPIWSSVTWRRWYLGHVHHESVGSHGRTVCETFPTTAPGDAWHVGYGYRAGRDMRCDVWHKRMGWSDRMLAYPVAIEDGRV